MRKLSKKSNPLEKKKVVLAKITEVELQTFKDFEATRAGLMRAIGLLEDAQNRLWETIKKDYKITVDKTLTLNKETKEIFYDNLPGFLDEE